MNVIESQPQSLTEQALIALQSFEPMVDQVLSYANLTVAEDGIGKVEEAHKAVKRLRIDLDKKRKELNEGALSYQRTVNATAKTLTERISKVESRLEGERETYEEAKRKEKAAKDAEKAAVLNERVKRLTEAGVVVSDLAAVGAMDATDFEFYFARESRIAEEAKAELKRQTEELQIRQEELRIQRQQQDAERAAEIEKIRMEREAMEAERAEMRRQQEDINRHNEELRAKAEAEAAEKRRQEREAEEARKLALAAPELEKLEVVLNAIRDAAGKAVVDCGEPAWCVHLDEALNRLAIDMRLVVRQSV
jgi:chromosome segregation ATPase